MRCGHVVDGAALSSGEAAGKVLELCDALHEICADGWYASVEVYRPWSVHNPRITGEFARPKAIRRYLQRELTNLLTKGATVTVRPSRPALALDDPALFRALDEWGWDLRAKKLFLFGPERQALSMERIQHYSALRPSRSSATCSSRTTTCTSRRSVNDSLTPKAPIVQACRCRRSTTAGPTATACHS